MISSEYRVAIIDDEMANTESLERILKGDGAHVIVFHRPQEALNRLSSSDVDVVLTDLRMEGMNGLEFLEAMKLKDPMVEVIMMTAFGTVELAVTAMKKGACDFITKPLQRVQVLKSLHMALDRRGLLNENRLLRQELQSQADSNATLVGRSPAIRESLDLARRAARSKAHVLIVGESGTGKGLLAEFIHKHSDSFAGILVKINCAAIPENLLEAELFGFEAGAFTGAIKQKKGRVELADHGSLFLDELGIAPVSVQTKLLRFVQDGEFERLGGNETRRIVTRIISATNVDLKAVVEAKQFREDLYYRINVITIRTPALRERPEDIPLLAQHFLSLAAKKNARSVNQIHPDALEALASYPWPGNVRELQNVMERAVVLCQKDTIGLEELSSEISGEKRLRVIRVPVGTPLRDAEKLFIDETLRHARGDKKLAARILGIHPRTIHRHLGEEQAEETIL